MRFKFENGERVPLTQAEETARDAEELAWNNRPQPTQAELNLAAVNDALVQPGSIFRAFVLVMLDEINILRTRPANSPALQPRTIDQIKPAIAGKMNGGG